jgi:repressor LexA
MPRPLQNFLSAAQRRLILAIAGLENRGEPAFVMEVVNALRLKGESSVVPTLRRIERKGFINIKGGGRGRSRIVHLTQRGRFAAAVGGIPVLGTIPAGPLEEAVAQTDVLLDERQLLPVKPGDFALQVKGDSMVGDGILEGDKVLLRPNVQAENGEIAAVIVGDDHEATLKRVFFNERHGKVVLRASNPRYADRHLNPRSIRIAGVFRGLVRDARR